MTRGEENKKCFIVMAAVIVCFAFSPLQAGAETWLERQKLLDSDGFAADQFGHSVSISGDLAIVASNGDDDKGNNSGSACIFKRNGATWSEQEKLLASDGNALDVFGISVSISGDLAIVGADLDDDKGTDSGSVYIFKWDGATWSEQAKLTASDGAAGDHFGISVSTTGDYVIVGAYLDDSYKGSAYIFKWDGATWSEQAKLTASDGNTNDFFGCFVSISGEYAIVGAYGDDSYKGSAYIFKRDGTSWSQQQKLTALDSAAGDYFGYSVSISSDLAIVGAYLDDDKGTDSGSAYIFKRDGATWSEQAKPTASDGAAGDWFGYSVSISGDYVIVGAQHDNDKGNYSGSAYILMRCPAADLSGDCCVNFADLAILGNQWLQAPGVPSADIVPLPDGDGMVDFLDLAIFADWWLYGTD